LVLAVADAAPVPLVPAFAADNGTESGASDDDAPSAIDVALLLPPVASGR
jgi:hypothetical protein